MHEAPVCTSRCYYDDSVNNFCLPFMHWTFFSKYQMFLIFLPLPHTEMVRLIKIHYHGYWKPGRLCRQVISTMWHGSTCLSFDVFCDLRPNKRLSKQSWGWWFETISCSLWRHCNENWQCNGGTTLYIGLLKSCCVFYEHYPCWSQKPSSNMSPCEKLQSLYGPKS